MSGREGCPTFRVGFALKKEKAQKHIRKELVECAKSRGIEIVLIDEYVPLEDQGHFDAILQKIRRPEFERELEEYAANHPETRLCDPPKATLLLRNRNDMLNVIPKDGFEIEAPVDVDTDVSRVRCDVPTHLVLDSDVGFEQAMDLVRESGLSYPIIAKSLWADGRPGSHAIAVVWSEDGLRKLLVPDAQDGSDLSAPVLLEQYVNHGECLFKVYVLGDQMMMVTRPSLHLDMNECKTCVMEPVSRVSAYPRSRSWGKGDLAPKGHGVPTPPQWAWKAIARTLKHNLGLTLFNFDIIVPLHPPAGLNGFVSDTNAADTMGLLHLIDVNYYPGVEKLPQSELVICNFLDNLLGATRKNTIP